MTYRWLVVLAAGLVACMTVPATADFYDSFYDGTFVETGPWDIDDPCWEPFPVLYSGWDMWVVGSEKWLRMWVTNVLLGTSFLATFPEDGDADPNSSATLFDDTGPHYIVARTANGELNDDPNADKGMTSLLLRSKKDQWLTFWILYEYGKDWPWRGAWFSMAVVESTSWDASMGSTHIAGGNYRYYPGSPKGYVWGTLYPNREYEWWLTPLYDPNDPNFWDGRPSWAPQFDPNYYPNVPDNLDPSLYDPNDPNWQDPRDPNWMLADANMLDPNNMWADPNFMDEHNGFWIAFQFVIIDPNYPSGDPNGKGFKATCWNGGKFDWDGNWILEHDMTGWNAGDPNGDYWPDAYTVTGYNGIASWGSDEFGIVSDVAFDNVESRHGVFTNVGRWLTLKKKDCQELTVDPDLLAEPNQDPNNLNLLRRYTDGTAIVLHSVVPVGNKAFKKWTIKGPNDSGDPSYQVVVDTNEVVYLTMDGDYLVKATCKCGGGGIEPFAAIVLMVLGLGVLVRRLT